MNGVTWTAYETSPAIKQVIDKYFAKLNEFVSSSKKNIVKKEQKQKEEKTKPKTKVKHEKKKKAPERRQTKQVRYEEDKDVEWVERIPEELKLMRRYVNMDGKVKTYDQVLSLINSLQRAIIERRIRKSSTYAKQVEQMQRKLIEIYNERKGESTQVKIAPKALKEFKELIHKEMVYKSVQFIKRFIGIQGKTGVKEKARKLYDSMARAADKGVIKGNDKYAKKLRELYKILAEFLNDENETRLAMDKEELNGLIGLVKDCNCGGLDGIDVPEYYEEEEEEPKEDSHVMSSMDFADMKFNTIGLQGKWLAFMGDAAPGFSAMVFGRPKMGKSHLCIEFAGYLSRNHGKVLYVAREEGFDATLQKKLNDTEVKNANLYISDTLPADLSPYDFIFLDSVNKLGLSPSDLDKLRKENPRKSFIFVFQTTKDGKFRGENEFQHDVDIVIEVGERGKAVQFGRYNQGGEINVFGDATHVF